MKPFTSVALLFLSLVSLIQIIRFFLGISIVVAGFAIPVWMSLVAGLVLGGLVFAAWREQIAG